VIINQVMMKNQMLLLAYQLMLVISKLTLMFNQMFLLSYH